ncbi:MAG: alpha-amylase family protein [Prevotellaceae bacterium]|nr:alpha-amylase family protein [Prevotellaceae bacterium]MDY6198811.1 alpha-amylase family protein [Prevotella sp.]
MDKIIIYQIFTRLYGNKTHNNIHNGSIEQNGCGKLNFYTLKELKRIKAMGISHIWFTGVIRHATQTDYSSFDMPANHPAVVKGKAGSPYAISDYYDIDPDLADKPQNRMTEFMNLVDRVHRCGMKVIIDFVPNHVARQYHSIAKPQGVDDLGQNDDTKLGFSTQNNFYYCPGCELQPSFSLEAEGFSPYVEIPAKATGNDHFDNKPGVNDWYETVKLNYGVDYYAGGNCYFYPVPDTWNKMVDIMLFWAGKGVDAFRCDMAEMVPSAFWAWATAKVKDAYPHIMFIGEVYNPALYRTYIASGFDFLYDKVGMYDTLRAVTCFHTSANEITAAWQANDDISSHMLYFLENHDEQRIASDFFAADAIKGIPALGVSLLMRNNPFMLYAGQEFGEKGMDEEGFSGKDGRTTIFDYWSVDSLWRCATGNLTDEQIDIFDRYQTLLSIARKEKVVAEGAFFDLMYVNPTSEHFDSHRQYAFLRHMPGVLMLVVANFNSVSRSVSINIPEHAFSFLGIKKQKVKASDLTSGQTYNLELSESAPVTIDVNPWGVAVVKMKIR